LIRSFLKRFFRLTSGVTCDVYLFCWRIKLLLPAAQNGLDWDGVATASRLGKNIVPKSGRKFAFVCSFWLRLLRIGALLQAFTFITRRLGPFFGNITDVLR